MEKNHQKSDPFFISNKKTDTSKANKHQTKKNFPKTEGKPNKKAFDKKKWRLQKYSKKYKLEQWEDKRKKAVLREYYKEIKDDKPKVNVQKIYEKYDSDNEETHPQTSKESQNKTNENKNSLKGKQKSIAYKKALNEFQRIKAEKLAKKEEFAKKKAEKEEALLKYKKNKTEKLKKLNKKTKKGQPIMKDRIEMLLEKIQNN